MSGGGRESFALIAGEGAVAVRNRSLTGARLLKDSRPLLYGEVSL
jgi:hypothetical protein